MNERVYPDWVQAHKVRGTTVKKVGDNYYLYKHTSKRVPGKKYPQPVDTYIGVITQEGVIESKKKKVSLTEIEVKEYGFSKALFLLCPESFKTPLGDDWEDVLSIIIRKWSPESYLTKERTIKNEADFHYQFAAQMGTLGRKLYKEHGIRLAELEILKTIYLVYLENGSVVSKINEEQKRILDKAGIKQEMC